MCRQISNVLLNWVWAGRGKIKCKTKIQLPQLLHCKGVEIPDYRIYHLSLTTKKYSDYSNF